ncbi:hypothetical protein R5R35_001859 [Gryllus longicercus]|uniref:Uncharacterized protein n=1 Tax=Gryllus longicercus TaxID=2509291 RepID=A0AAN9VNR6_9ORTH
MQFSMTNRKGNTPWKRDCFPKRRKRPLCNEKNLKDGKTLQWTKAPQFCEECRTNGRVRACAIQGLLWWCVPFKKKNNLNKLEDEEKKNFKRKRTKKMSKKGKRIKKKKRRRTKVSQDSICSKIVQTPL